MVSPAADVSVAARATIAAGTEWDAFADRCGASFRCAHAATRGWQYETHVVHRLHRLDLWATVDGQLTKVGQAAVGVGRRWRVFADALQLLPGHQQQWTAGMSAVLDRLGPGAYVYGSDWNPEPPRHHQITDLPGVTVTAVRPTELAVVDLSRWPTFDDYLRSVSCNVRRNAKKAAGHWPTLAVGPPVGVRDRWASLRLRGAMYRRKGIRRSTLGMVARSAARAACTRGYAEPIHATADRRLLAMHVGIDFGRRWYYLEGGSVPDDHGAAWHLMLGVIAGAYGRGCHAFVMGSDDGTQVGTPAWDGLRRSRAQCGATFVPTSTMTFDYRPARLTPSEAIPAARPPAASAIPAGRR